MAANQQHFFHRAEPLVQPGCTVQLNSEDSKPENKAMLAISPKAETFTWQVNPNPQKIAVSQPFLRVFAVPLLFTPNCGVQAQWFRATLPTSVCRPQGQSWQAAHRHFGGGTFVSAELLRGGELAPKHLPAYEASNALKPACSK